LIVVDVQNDFLPGGALAVPRGDEVIAPILDLQRVFDLTIATQDWHPAHHGSFASQHPGHVPGEVIELFGLPQVLWPDHCVQGSAGAELAAALPMAGIAKVFRKGSDPKVDSYSGFFDNGRQHDTGMGKWLRERGVDEVCICGLALDYCVKATALDAVGLGFKTLLALDGCRAVALEPGDGERAVAAMQRGGVELMNGR
jgi:nicotinamidase/pyrazinamidase